MWSWIVQTVRGQFPDEQAHADRFWQVRYGKFSSPGGTPDLRSFKFTWRPSGRALVSDPEPGKAGEDDLKPLLHKVRKWLSGPDAGAERVTTRVGYIKARSR